MTPNTKKPTEEEVGDEEKCWVWTGINWTPHIGKHVRLKWEGFAYRGWDAWLPYSAIPDPNNTQQGEPK